jgi:hypothetical protein
MDVHLNGALFRTGFEFAIKAGSHHFSIESMAQEGHQGFCPK